MYEDLRQKYNPDGSNLRKYQLQLLKVLIEFDQFCKDNDIEYYLAYGTLLGAVRHKGFIPWDDDADLWMNRENYNKLKLLMKGQYHQLSENVYINYSTRPCLWAYPFADIDIFILDKCPNNKILRQIKQIIIYFINAVIKCKSRLNSHKIRPLKLWLIFSPVALFASLKFWHALLDKVSTFSFFQKKKSDYLQVYNEVLSSIHCLYPNDECWDIEYASFEGYTFPIPKGFHKIMSIKYGDYMSIPKEKYIHNHNIINNI